MGGSEEDGWLTGEADVDDEGAALVGAVGGPGDGAGEVGDVSAVVQRDGDARDLPVAVALGELLLHARDVHHRRRRHLLEPREMGGRRRAGKEGDGTGRRSGNRSCHATSNNTAANTFNCHSANIIISTLIWFSELQLLLSK